MTFALFTKFKSDYHTYLSDILANTKLIENQDNPKYVFVIGGDGTFLHAFQRYKAHPIYITINKGTLGFYSHFKISDLSKIYSAINNDLLKIDHACILFAKLITKDSVSYFNALNEITINSIPKTLSANVFINNFKFEMFHGSGLLISTPQGSSAYNKSLNGAVLDHSLEVMQLTEISGINSTYYHTLNSPLVLSNKNIIRLELNTFYKVVYLTYDNYMTPIRNFISLEVKLDNNKAKLAYLESEHFLSKIRRSFIPNH